MTLTVRRHFLRRTVLPLVTRLPGHRISSLLPSPGAIHQPPGAREMDRNPVESRSIHVYAPSVPPRPTPAPPPPHPCPPTPPPPPPHPPTWSESVCRKRRSSRCPLGSLRTTSIAPAASESGSVPICARISSFSSATACETQTPFSVVKFSGKNPLTARCTGMPSAVVSIPVQRLQ